MRPIWLYDNTITYKPVMKNATESEGHEVMKKVIEIDFYTIVETLLTSLMTNCITLTKLP